MVMNYARKILPREDGYRHFGRNRAGTHSTLTFKQGQNTKNYIPKHFLCILHIFTMNLRTIVYILNAFW